MIQGTGSDVGKSLIVAGLARAFANRGLRVVPFKPQNMSNNAAVTADGGEIGRAQALQARAARVAPTVDMNPVLLKPQSEVGSQVVVQGRILGNARAAEYQSMKPGLMAAVLDSFNRLAADADLVLVEGAGSAAEVNLRGGDIANMGFAEAAGVPVVLLGDIDRGGVIAQIVGTKAVIPEPDAARIVGFLVNKFRGDSSLFASGMAFIAENTGWPALGLIPHFADAGLLPAEDAVVLSKSRQPGDGALTIAVPVLPHIANFDDLDPLQAEPSVRLVMLKRGQPLPAETDVVLLPGSKATISDLAALRAEGWDIDILAHARRGGRVVGICGGYQMLGRRIADPQGIEGPAGSVAGLGLLDVETVLTAEKSLIEVAGTLAGSPVPFAGYEMHVGETSGADSARPALSFADGRPDGATSADGRIEGHYVHGVFNADAARAALIARWGGMASDLAFEARVEATLDRLAAHVAAHVDLDRLLKLAR
ncbi:MAG: cobyric acid synthase [Ancalomicrobiaceae bacterium]|nr:cobyric acid synthase [Ancalomicrobiaceae bacterium]